MASAFRLGTFTYKESYWFESAKCEWHCSAVVNYSDGKLLAYYEYTFVGISGHFLRKSNVYWTVHHCNS